MKLIDALPQGLADHGVERTFGIPGDFALPHLRAALESGRRPLHALSHESSVGLAADAARVLSNCVTQSRPVYLEFPRDLVDAPVTPVPTRPPPRHSREAVADGVDEVRARVDQARSPVMMLGVEVRRFRLESKVSPSLARLVATLSSPQRRT